MVSGWCCEKRTRWVRSLAPSDVSWLDSMALAAMCCGKHRLDDPAPKWHSMIDPHCVPPRLDLSLFPFVPPPYPDTFKLSPKTMLQRNKFCPWPALTAAICQSARLGAVPTSSRAWRLGPRSRESFTQVPLLLASAGMGTTDPRRVTVLRCRRDHVSKYDS